MKKNHLSLVCGIFIEIKLQKKMFRECLKRMKKPTNLKNYLDQSTIPLTENILKVWIDRQIYPFLYTNVEPHLTIIITSVPLEWLFSKTGNIITENKKVLSVVVNFFKTKNFNIYMSPLQSQNKVLHVKWENRHHNYWQDKKDRLGAGPIIKMENKCY